jgi:hypothetical protein
VSPEKLSVWGNFRQRALDTAISEIYRKTDLRLEIGLRALAGVLTHLRGIVEERDFFESTNYVVHLGNCTLKFDRIGT